MKIFRILFLVIFPFSVFGNEGAVPHEVSYQAILKGADGQLLGQTDPIIYEVTMRIWNADTDGQLIWSERQSVSVFKGRLAMVLGTGALVDGDVLPVPRPALPDVFGGDSHYAEISFKDLSDAEAVAVTLNQRQRLVGVPTAFRAALAEELVPGYLLGANELMDGVLTSVQIAPNAVTQEKLSPNTIESGQLALEAVTADHFGVGSVTSDGIKNGDLETANIMPSGLSANNLEVGAVTSEKVADASIIGSKFQSASLSGGAIADNGLTAADLQVPVGAINLRDTNEMGDTVQSISGGGSRLFEFDPVALGFPVTGVQGAKLRVGADISGSNNSYLIVFPGSDHEIPIDQINPALANSVLIDERFANSNLVDANGNTVSSEGNMMPQVETVYCPLRLRGDGMYEAKIYVAQVNLNDGSWDPENNNVSFKISILGSY